MVARAREHELSLPVVAVTTPATQQTAAVYGCVSMSNRPGLCRSGAVEIPPGTSSFGVVVSDLRKLTHYQHPRPREKAFRRTWSSCYSPSSTLSGVGPRVAFLKIAAWVIAIPGFDFRGVNKAFRRTWSSGYRPPSTHSGVGSRVAFCI